MAVVDIGTASKPQAFYTQQWRLQLRTSDPPNPKANEPWIRTDLDSGDKLASLRWNLSGGPYDFPIFPAGMAGDNVSEQLRVQTDSWVGFVPTTTATAAHPEAEIATGGERYGLHDDLTAITAPDSVVWQVSPSTFSTGEGAYADQVGNNDVSLTGDLQEATLSNGDPSVESDGAEDSGLFSLPSEVSGASLNNYAIEFEIEYTAGGTMIPFGILDGDQIIQLQLNRDVNNDDDNGNIRIGIEDTNSDRMRAAAQSNPNLDSGDRTVVLVNVFDAANNDLGLIVDDSDVTLAYDVTEGPGSWKDWTVDCGLFARSVDGSPDQYFDGELGIVRLHDSDQSSTTL